MGTRRVRRGHEVLEIAMRCAQLTLPEPRTPPHLPSRLRNWTGSGHCRWELLEERVKKPELTAAVKVASARGQWLPAWKGIAEGVSMQPHAVDVY